MVQSRLSSLEMSGDAFHSQVPPSLRVRYHLLSITPFNIVVWQSCQLVFLWLQDHANVCYLKFLHHKQNNFRGPNVPISNHDVGC